MTRTTARWLLSAALTVITYAASTDRPAQALTVNHTSPWGATAPVIVYVGSGSCAGGATCQFIAWIRRSDNQCLLEAFGGVGGVDATTQIIGSPGADMMYSVTNGTTIPAIYHGCGNSTLNAPIYNGHIIALFGRGGDDNLSALNSGETWVIGEDGNDVLNGFGTGNLVGGNGNDRLFGNSPFANDSLKGDAGNDCMSDKSNSAITFDCGTGTDTVVTGPSGTVPSNMLHCESISTTCP